MTFDRATLEDEFVARLRERWKQGAIEYGDESFGLPIHCTAAEILQEVEDVAGWAFVAWVQMRERLGVVRSSASALEKRTGSAHDLAVGLLCRLDQADSRAVGDYATVSIGWVRNLVRQALAAVSTAAGSPATSPPPH